MSFTPVLNTPLMETPIFKVAHSLGGSNQKEDYNPDNQF
jgi:hypothetical protein